MSAQKALKACAVEACSGAGAHLRELGAVQRLVALQQLNSQVTVFSVHILQRETQEQNQR